MAISTGWKRLHIAMLVLVGIWAVGFVIGGIGEMLTYKRVSGDGIFFILLGLAPLLLYLLIAWVVAGFLRRD